MSVIVNSLPKGTILHGKSYNYIIRETLGQGSFGITYLASVKLEGRLGTLDSQAYVCVKEFFMKDRNGRKEDSVTCEGDTTLFDKYRKDFTREALNLSRVHHPNIVKVLESFECNGTSYYTMEYIDGQSLDDYIISNNGMSEHDALSALRIVASAVECMHQNNMLHLDIKPLNIMRQNDGKLMLIDFGLSKQFNKDGEPESSTSIGGGTLGYAPLEQNNYKRGMGFPATLDVYALGATLYKCITSDTPPEASIILNEGAPLSILKECGVSAGTIRLIEETMEPIVRKRLHSVGIFLSKVEGLLVNANKNKTERLGRTADDKVVPSWKVKTNDEEQVAIKDFYDSLKKTSSGCFVGKMPAYLFNLISSERRQHDSPKWLTATARIYEIEQLLESLQTITGAHWRLPDFKELMTSFDDDVSGIPSGRCYLYFNPQDATLHSFEEFGGEKGVISNWDFHISEFLITLVLDPKHAENVQTFHSSFMRKIDNTCFIVDDKGLWRYGYCPVRHGNDWGVIDVYGNFVLHLEFDEQPQIGFMSYPAPGPGLRDDLRIKYRKGTQIGYYKIKGNGRIDFEIECTEKEWNDRKMWT